MLDSIRDLVARTKALRKAVRALKTAQVRRNADRNSAKSIVDDYFRKTREHLVIEGLDAALIDALDSGMQSLLDASQQLSVKATYDSTLKALVGELQVAEKQALLGASSVPEAAAEPIDQRILKTLAGILPSAARAYEQAMRDLTGGERLSWRGPATDLRESLRETLDHLAPDEGVLAQPGFKLEKDARGPTMKQKTRYILSKRGYGRGATKSAEAAAVAVDELVGAFVRSVYTRSSISTHTPTEREEVLRVHSYVRVCLCELLEVHAGA